ncbi:acetolactate synthase large subunit [Piscirickettsia litoralis]|uniref:Acetolactate synthase n=1 Tax=Piscirickettsia litoralis TaxID=1891921 RepID=A0ABX3A3N1_9GAMM|nr:acetolactate synthase large subunit [Piscirickettsia litoralis]ODN42040.1 acetolactate synthase [Piscirickettsia litoralis]
MKASDLFLRCLEKQGVNTIYGVPGEENADLMISLLDSPIEFITTRHEQTASFMAEMHGRLTGIPGVCLATLGPGATNLLTGVAQANMDNAPLVAVIGQAESARLHKESHQNMDAVSMFKAVTKWSTTIREADAIPEVIAKAFKVATSGVPGAVLIELPEDIAHHQTNARPLQAFQKNIDIGTTDHQLNKALELLKQSQKPLLLIGDGAVRTESDKQLATFLDKTKLYSAHTFMGKGAVSNLYERSLHCVGLGMKDVVIEAFEQADLVICIGYDLVEYPPSRWNTGVHKKIIHIGAAAAEVDMSYVPDLEMVGHIPTIIDQVNEKLSADYCKEDTYFKVIQEKAQHDIRSDKADDSFPMKPKRILQDVRATLADSDMLVSDVGAHKMWVARQYGARQSKTCFISNGFCSMGGSMPGALEAKRLNPDKNVVAVCGDGGFMMSIQALSTGVQLKVPFVTVLWEDDSYGLIEWKQEMGFNTSSPHVHLENPDLAKLAEAFGCHSIRINAANEFIPALENALGQQDVPTVIVVPVDYSENMKLFHHLHRVVR